MNTEDITSELKRLNPGGVPLDIFNELARLLVIPVIELVVEYQNKVLVKKRPNNDHYWPNMYCLPGRIVSAKTQKSLTEQVEELYVSLNILSDKKPVIIFNNLKLLNTKRGVELAIVYKVLSESYSDDNESKFISKIDISKMDNVISEHQEIIADTLL